MQVRGVAGRGGEYEVVEGFGWTNGVAIRFLNEYGSMLSTSGSLGLVPSDILFSMGLIALISLHNLLAYL